MFSINCLFFKPGGKLFFHQSLFFQFSSSAINTIICIANTNFNPYSLSSNVKIISKIPKIEKIAIIFQFISHGIVQRFPVLSSRNRNTETLGSSLVLESEVRHSKSRNRSRNRNSDIPSLGIGTGIESQTF